MKKDVMTFCIKEETLDKLLDLGFVIGNYVRGKPYLSLDYLNDGRLIATLMIDKSIVEEFYFVNQISYNSTIMRDKVTKLSFLPHFKDAKKMLDLIETVFPKVREILAEERLKEHAL